MAIRDLLTVKEAAEILGVTRGRVYQWITEERLDGIKLQREILLDKRDVEQFAKEERPNGRPRKVTSEG